MPKRPVLYSQPNCPGCDSARAFFGTKEILYLERNISEDPEAHREFIELGMSSTPVIVVNGRKILGFQRLALEEALGFKQEDGRRGVRPLHRRGPRGGSGAHWDADGGQVLVQRPGRGLAQGRLASA